MNNSGRVGECCQLWDDEMMKLHISGEVMLGICFYLRKDILVVFYVKFLNTNKLFFVVFPENVNSIILYVSDIISIKLNDFPAATLRVTAFPSSGKENPVTILPVSWCSWSLCDRIIYTRVLGWVIQDEWENTVILGWIWDGSVDFGRSYWSESFRYVVQKS